MLTKDTKSPHAKIAIPGDKKATIAFCIDHWVNIAKESIQDHGAFYVALSGGSTPKAIYQALATSHNETIDWKKVHLFWSDERSVPPSHDESNYRMAMDSGLGKLPIPEDNIHRMVAEEDIGTGATEYENTIHSVLKDRPFDLVMLGMGDDGHTASLFPETSALEEKTRTVVANYVQKKETWRMTMTYPLINAARHIAVYVIGKEKSDMLYNILIENAPLPSHEVGSEGNKALWIADQEAAEKTSAALS